MIDDKERRDVAARLRAAALRGNGERVTDGELVDVIAYECGVEGADGFDDRLLERLADLIDRPTCHDTGSGYTFECSECGCRIGVILRDSREGEPAMTVHDDPLYEPSYCPNCGKEVVE